jgi:hypothetical protein
VMTARGFPGLFATWDCKHFNWKNCPVRHQGQNQGFFRWRQKDDQIGIHLRPQEAPMTSELWRCSFLNDLIVLEKSSIVGAMIEGKLSLRIDPHEINGTVRDWMYFLIDGIYPNWAIFVKTFSCPTEVKKKKFAVRQEKIRMDIENAFGIAVSSFHALEHPICQWCIEDMHDLVHCCCILHNVIVVHRCGDVGDSEATEEDNDDQKGGFALFGRDQVAAAEAHTDGVDLFAARMSAFDMRMQSQTEHFCLRNDLVEHISRCI